jgi:hypothetical protein
MNLKCEIVTILELNGRYGARGKRKSVYPGENGAVKGVVDGDKGCKSIYCIGFLV